MAQQFLASIYGYNGNAVGTSAGQPQTFPSAGVRIYPAPSSTTFNGVTAVSIIEILPTGLNQKGRYFYSAATVVALQTLANA
jgi:hypothetical protein